MNECTPTVGLTIHVVTLIHIGPIHNPSED